MTNKQKIHYINGKVPGVKIKIDTDTCHNYFEGLQDLWQYSLSLKPHSLKEKEKKKLNS